MRKALLAAVAVSVVAVITILDAQVSVPNIPAFPQMVTFGMTGLANDQTARVNALGLPVGGPIIANALCQVTMQFLDDHGKMLASSTQPVIQGESVHFDLRRADIDVDTDRREIRATVRTAFITPTATPVAFGCSVLPTLEIFNQDTGRTMTMITQTQSMPLIIPLGVTGPQ